MHFILLFRIYRKIINTQILFQGRYYLISKKNYINEILSIAISIMSSQNTSVNIFKNEKTQTQRESSLDSYKKNASSEFFPIKKTTESRSQKNDNTSSDDYFGTRTAELELDRDPLEKNTPKSFVFSVLGKRSFHSIEDNFNCKRGARDPLSEILEIDLDIQSLNSMIKQVNQSRKNIKKIYLCKLNRFKRGL